MVLSHTSPHGVLPTYLPTYTPTYPQKSTSSLLCNGLAEQSAATGERWMLGVSLSSSLAPRHQGRMKELSRHCRPPTVVIIPLWSVFLFLYSRAAVGHKLAK